MCERDPTKGLDQFDVLAQSLRAHPSKAQILIEVKSEEDTLETTLAVLKKRGIQPLQHRILREGDSVCVLLHLSNEGMGEAVLKLAEAGFTRLKGISPQPASMTRRETFYL